MCNVASHTTCCFYDHVAAIKPQIILWWRVHVEVKGNQEYLLRLWILPSAARPRSLQVEMAGALNAHQNRVKRFSGRAQIRVGGWCFFSMSVKRASLMYSPVCLVVYSKQTIWVWSKYLNEMNWRECWTWDVSKSKDERNKCRRLKKSASQRNK